MYKLRSWFRMNERRRIIKPGHSLPVHESSRGQHPVTPSPPTPANAPARTHRRPKPPPSAHSTPTETSASGHNSAVHPRPARILPTPATSEADLAAFVSWEGFLVVVGVTHVVVVGISGKNNTAHEEELDEERKMRMRTQANVLRVARTRQRRLARGQLASWCSRNMNSSSASRPPSSCPSPNPPIQGLRLCVCIQPVTRLARDGRRTLAARCAKRRPTGGLGAGLGQNSTRAKHERYAGGRTKRRRSRNPNTSVRVYGDGQRMGTENTHPGKYAPGIPHAPRPRIQPPSARAHLPPARRVKTLKREKSHHVTPQNAARTWTARLLPPAGDGRESRIHRAYPRTSGPARIGSRPARSSAHARTSPRAPHRTPRTSGPACTARARGAENTHTNAGDAKRQEDPSRPSTLSARVRVHTTGQANSRAPALSTLSAHVRAPSRPPASRNAPHRPSGELHMREGAVHEKSAHNASPRPHQKKPEFGHGMWCVRQRTRRHPRPIRDRLRHHPPVSSPQEEGADDDGGGDGEEDEGSEECIGFGRRAIQSNGSEVVRGKYTEVEVKGICRGAGILIVVCVGVVVVGGSASNFGWQRLGSYMQLARHIPSLDKGYTNSNTWKAGVKRVKSESMTTESFVV
ncbi:hypothetical protein C8F04DRAFT_1315332 [Mycena alexandri]|uniref:Uncharacterized protein n=1 Tax=Mycena alexandri TaxID=1745969 RepID=A0AAD6WU89_9AGAR|nr:hypothetical protein C8F04DRAFT_1315332 [Mycena alexandri]